jgi:hypothetical protein
LHWGDKDLAGVVTLAMNGGGVDTNLGCPSLSLFALVATLERPLQRYAQPSSSSSSASHAAAGCATSITSIVSNASEATFFNITISLESSDLQAAIFNRVASHFSYLRNRQRRRVPRPAVAATANSGFPVASPHVTKRKKSGLAGTWTWL